MNKSVSFIIPGQPVDIQSILDYSPETGEFKWKVNSTRIKAGDFAGTTDRRGYVRIRIGRKKYAAHRLAWLISTGEDPAHMTIDHINGNKSDNRISNLRLATNAENQRNKGRYATNKTGIKGVFLDAKKGRYSASIRVNGKLKHLGYFDDPNVAAQAYAVAADKWHGEFQNLGVRQ